MKKGRSVDELKEMFIGKKFGTITVTKHVGIIDGKQRWFCECECGESFTRRSEALLKNQAKCNCQVAETARTTSKKHGMHKTREYTIYYSMLTRCYKETNREYHRYGGRGITVCQRWLDSFENFLEDMGKTANATMSIDRIDNEKGYSPENCRWATKKEQSNNTRRNRFLTVNGVTDTLANHCRKYGILKGTVLGRLKRGLSEPEAFHKKDH